jgi:PAS domain S-box-containing protein
MRHTLQGQVTLGTPSHLQTTCEGATWHAVLTQALAQRQPLRLPDVSPAAPAADLGQTLRTLGWAASTLFPIMIGEQALGVLVFLYNDVHDVRTDWHTLGQAFADLMAFAMQAYERYCASQLEASQQAQRVAQLNILRELTRVLMETLDLSDMLQAMGTQLQAGLGYAGVSVWLYRAEPPGMQQVYRSGAHSGWQPERRDPIVFQVERVKNAQVVRAPIVLQGQTIGAVEFVRGPQYGPIAAFERELIQMVLDYLGMAVKNSRLYGEIKTTKQYLEHLINDAGDAIVTVDTTDTVTSWNASAARIFQYRPAEILWQPIWTLVPREQYMAWRDEVLQHGVVKHLETRLYQQNGAPVEVSLTVSPLRGVYDEMVGFSAIIRDVTEEKRLREQLMQTEKLRALGEMAAGVAHNFNNILTTILGHTQLLLEDLEGDRVAQEGLRTIEKTTKDAAQVVQRIQRFAKGKTAGSYQPTDVTLLIKEVIDATRPVWKEQAEGQGKGIALVFDPEPLPDVPCRAAEIREVLTNLILNGVDAMPSGGTLSLRTYQDGQFACIAVADTGTGMPEDVRRRIFDPFFTTKKEKGTGLGLSVSHTLIKGHGGAIEVQSVPGQGTTFVVQLPLEAVAGLEDEE